MDNPSQRSDGGSSRWKTERKRHFLASLLLSGPGLVWILVFLVFPFGWLAVISFLSRGEYGEIVGPFTWENYQRFFGFGWLGFDPLFPQIIFRSLLVGAATTALCILGGFPLAFFVASLPSRLKTLALTLVVIPLWTNLLIRTYAWQILLSADSPLAHLFAVLGLIPPGNALYPSLTAVMVGMVCDFLPFLVLPLYSSVEKIDWSVVEAAMDLGANRRQAFHHAVLPQVKPGLVAGAILTLIPAAGQFVVPDLLGGAKILLLGNTIQQEFGSSQDWPFGAAITLLTMALVLGGLWFYARLAGRQGEPDIL